MASESSYYRILREHGEQHHRGHARTTRPKGDPQRHRVTRPNACWSWDVTYLPTRVRGQFYYLYMIVDIYSRKIVDAVVFDQESMAKQRVHPARRPARGLHQPATGITRRQRLCHERLDAPGHAAAAEYYPVVQPPSGLQ